MQGGSMISFVKINRFVNSRSMVAVAAIIMLLGARMAFQTGDVSYLTSNRGFLVDSPNLWIHDTWLTMAVNTALILVTALSWIFIIQFFNPFRGLTNLTASLFIIMMTSVPDISDQLCTGTVLSAIVPVCLALLWSAYGDIHRLRHIYLLFAILSALAMTQYCFAVYIPMFIVGCAQMKIFRMKTILACIFGLATPWWIVFGLGIFDLSHFHAPHFQNALATMDTDAVVNLVAVSVTTVIIIVAAWVGNFMNIVSLNANLRAFNGSIALMAVFTIVALIADFGNATSYLPTLMSLTAYQISFMAVRNKDVQAFVPVVVVMTIYLAFYGMRMLL